MAIATETRAGPVPAIPPLSLDAVILSPVRRRFTVDEYYRMAEAGILHDGERVELLDGDVICMSPIGPRHAAGVKRANRWCTPRVGNRAVVSVQDPIRVENFAEPEPDLALLRPRADVYAGGHAQAADVLLVIEVAETSLAIDQTVKMRLYGRAGVLDAWLVDLPGRRVLVYREPGPEGYASLVEYHAGQEIVPLAFPDLAVPAAELLGV